MTSLKALFGLALLGLFTGLWLRGAHDAARARTSEALLASAVAMGNANAEVARLQALQTRRIDAIASVNALKKRDLRMDSDTRRKVIHDAPPNADGPLAPVLRDQLDRLPKPPGADARDDAAAAGDPAVAAAAE
ncbi:MAG: hypothetical protein AB7H70_14340 [Rhodospirillaceae bacterium]